MCFFILKNLFPPPFERVTKNDQIWSLMSKRHLNTKSLNGRNVNLKNFDSGTCASFKSSINRLPICFFSHSGSLRECCPNTFSHSVNYCILPNKLQLLPNHRADYTLKFDKSLECNNWTGKIVLWGLYEEKVCWQINCRWAFPNESFRWIWCRNSMKVSMTPHWWIFQIGRKFAVTDADQRVNQFFAGLVFVMNGLRPEIFSKNACVFLRSKHANFSFKCDFP